MRVKVSGDLGLQSIQKNSISTQPIEIIYLKVFDWSLFFLKQKQKLEKLSRESLVLSCLGLFSCDESGSTALSL
jgi:hypothetical protein